MKESKLRIGNKGEGKSITIPFNEPETPEEWYATFGDNQQFLVDCAKRGVRIKIQDFTRELVADELKKGTAPENVQRIVLDWLENNDITVKKERKGPGPRKPVEVAVPEGKQNFTLDELKAMLAASGVKIAGEPVEAATPATAGQPA